MNVPAPKKKVEMLKPSTIIVLIGRDNIIISKEIFKCIVNCGQA